MREKLKQLSKRQLTSGEFINILLYSVVIVMPFIVLKGEEYFILQFPNEVMDGMYNLPVHYVIGKVAFLYVVGISLLIMYFKGKKALKYKEQKIAVVYLMFYFIATLFSENIVVSILGNDFRYEGIIMIGIYILLFIMASKYIVINEKLIKIVLIAASIMGVYSIIQYYGFDPIQKWSMGKIYVEQSISFLRNRNVLGSYVSLFIPLSMGLYIFRGNKVYCYISSVIFASMLCSMTRAVWVSFLVFSIIGLVFVYKNKEMLKRVGVIIVIFTTIFSSISVLSNFGIGGNGENLFGRAISTIEDGVKFDEQSGSGRIKIWKGVIKCIKGNNLFGTGPDTMKLELESEGIFFKTHYDKSHNEFLEIWLTGGLFALISYLLLVGLILYKLIKKRKDDNIKIMILIVVSYVVQSFFSNSVILVAPLYWIMLGAFVKYVNEGFNNCKIESKA